MNIKGLLDCLEIIVESQKLRELGLTEEEIEGYFEFNWDSETDLVTSVLRRDINVEH